jgi:uncharacterized protein YegL
MRFFNKGPRDMPLDASGMVFAADNRAQRVLLALVLDTSHSMTVGEKITHLNDDLVEMQKDMCHAIDLRTKLEVALITFGDGGVIAWRGNRPAVAGESPYVPVTDLAIPKLSAGGVTPMVEALNLAMECVANRKAQLKAEAKTYYRPLIWLISDGLPTDSAGNLSDDWQVLPPKLREREEQKRFLFFAVAAHGIDRKGEAVLTALAPESHYRMEGDFNFRTVLATVSASAESVQTDNPTSDIYRAVGDAWNQAQAMFT